MGLSKKEQRARIGRLIFDIFKMPYRNDRILSHGWVCRQLAKKIGALPKKHPYTSIEQRLDATLKTLAYRTRETLMRSYGIGYENTMSEDQIVDLFKHSTIEGIRKHKKKGLRGLRDPHRILILLGFIPGPPVRGSE